jgi:MFS family permease
VATAVPRPSQGTGAADLPSRCAAIRGEDRAAGCCRPRPLTRALGNLAHLAAETDEFSFLAGQAGALAGALGPLIGGWLVDTTGWRTIFLLNLPIATAAGYLAGAYVPEIKNGRGAMSLDWAGAMLAPLSLALLTWSLTAAAEAAAAPGRLWAVAAAGLVILGGFLWLEAKRGDRAIMPFALFATRPSSG